MSTPFHIFPWNKPFIPPFKNFINELSGGQPGKAVIVTPHIRPARYMTNLYRKDKKARILPKMIRVNDLVSIWRAKLSNGPLYMANSLDQVSLLFECVRELNLDIPMSSSLKSIGSDIGTFLPWGMKLAKILEDMAIEGAGITNLPNLDFELGNTSASILSSLEEIGNLWEAKLRERNWTTPGQDHKFVAAHAEEIPDIFFPTSEHPVFLAGFYILTGTHKTLFKSLWKAGAHICLHTDPEIINDRGHWSCQYHSKWITDWNASAELISDKEEDGQKAEVNLVETNEAGSGLKCKNTFFAGYDLHSQMDEVGKLLRQSGSTSTAIIPCKEEALTAILQNLPPENVNVSIGYPMERSPLIRLFQSLLEMYSNSPRENYFRSADVLSVIRHPYIGMLREEPEGTDYRSSLFKLEKEILDSGLYWEKTGQASLAKGLIDTLNEHFSGIDTMNKLGSAVESFCRWLLEKGRDRWKYIYQLDQEVMFRLVNNVVPLFKNNLLSEEKFPGKILSSLFMEQIKEENIPFEADPIEGLQVIGLLESRLLQFDKVLIVDANDDVLPKKAGQDPLLPDSLRYQLNLPDNRQKEAASAHNLFRLLAGAKEAHFLWQEGTSGGEFYDSKKVRSRFIERLIWEEEKKRPELLEDNKSIVEHPRALLKISSPDIKPIIRNPELDRAIAGFWSRPVSMTSLDNYLSCPVQFIRNNIINLESPSEGQNRNILAGQYAHKVLEKIYDGMKGKLPEDLEYEAREKLIAINCDSISQEMRLADVLAPDEYEALNISIPKIIRRYLSKKSENSLQCLAQEEDLDGEISIDGKRIKLRGRIDRIDKGKDGLYIIDYKTGRDLPKNNPDLWDDGDFFANVARACKEKDVDELEACFNLFRKKISSLQLPAYLLLLSQSDIYKKDGFPANALWAPLRYSKKEEFLLSSPLTGESDPRLNHFREAINLVYNHMTLLPEFRPDKNKICERCAGKTLCGIK